MIEIREATIADVPTIQLLAEAIWYPTYSTILSQEQIRFMLDYIYDIETVSNQITQGVQNYLLLLENGHAIGFASFSPRAENPKVHKLHKLYCLTQTKGRGFGKALLQEVEKRVLAAGNKILELNVNRHNPAKIFYEKCGFTVVSEEDIPIGQYWMNDYVMRKEL
jgi:ribosomal protein S18 acetylase RimI-like enzyme